MTDSQTHTHKIDFIDPFPVNWRPNNNNTFSRVLIFVGLIFAGTNFRSLQILDISWLLIFAVGVLAAIPANTKNILSRHDSHFAGIIFRG